MAQDAYRAELPAKEPCDVPASKAKHRVVDIPGKPVRAGVVQYTGTSDWEPADGIWAGVEYDAYTCLRGRKRSNVVSLKF